MKLWDYYSYFYDLIMGNSEKNEEFMNYLLKFVNKENTLLDAACGTGIFTASFSPYVKKVNSCDYSKKMILQTEKKINKMKLKNVETSIQDISNLNFEDNSFDVVIAANVLHLLENPEKGINELKRVVKKEGLLIFPTYITGNINLFQKILLLLFNLTGYKSEKWTEKEYINFLKENDLDIIEYKTFSLKEPNCAAIIKNNI